MGLLDKIRKTKKDEEISNSENKQTDVKVEKKSEKKKSDIAPKSVSSKGKKKNNNNHKIIVKPLISEKAAIGESRGEYTFVVNVNATKGEIKNAIESIYGLRPSKVRTVNYEGKKVRFGYRFGKRSDWKKALVQVPKGKVLSIHEGV